MKLTYFVAPYDLIDIKTKKAVPLTFDLVVEKRLGYSATVCIEPSEKQWKLQIQNLANVNQSAKAMPSFSAVSNLNSCTLPAYFVLKLTRPLPMSLELAQQISAITKIDWLANFSRGEQLISLIAKQVVPEKERQRTLNGLTSQLLTGPFYVKLPDQEHCYHMNDEQHMDALMVTTVPFTHPSHVPQILVLLRQQVLFNVIIGSCIRKLSAFNSPDRRLAFEVSMLSMSHATVCFEHPVEESLATMDIDMQDITQVKCKLHNANSFSNLCTDDYASKIMQK